jgi:thiol-disulfide isomerase/thioredoxin
MKNHHKDIIMDTMHCANAQYYQLIVIDHDIEGIEDYQVTYLIDPTTYLPVLYEKQFNQFGNLHCSTVNYYNCQVNQGITFEKFSLDSAINSNTKIDYFSPVKSKINLDTLTKIQHFEGITQNRETFQSIDLAGKPGVIIFWFSGCYPCMLAMNFLQEYRTKSESADFFFLGINGVNSFEDFKKYIDRMGYSHLNVLVDKEMIENHGVGSYPTFLAFDKNFNIVFKAVGWNDTTGNQLLETLGKLNISN